MQETGVEGKRWDADQMAAIIARAKDNLYAPDAFVSVPGDFFQESIGKVYARYQQLLLENNAVDFADLIRLSVQVLRQNPETLAFYQQLFRYVLVDEYQDSAFGQYQLVRHLVWRHRNLCCVGSPVQAIYAWRGADITNILQRFRVDFPNAVHVVLGTNYRCSGRILATAQRVVRDLPYREELRTVNAPGDPVAVAAFHTDGDEANYVATEIQRLIEHAHYRYADCAILFRTRAQGQLMEQVLMHRELPYTFLGDLRFFEHREIKDAIAYLRLTHDPFDAGALQRIINRPPRGLGTAALAQLQAGEPELTFAALDGWETRTDLPERVRRAAGEFRRLIVDDLQKAARTLGLAELLEHILAGSGYLQWLQQDSEGRMRLAHLTQLQVLARRYAGTSEALAAFLSDIAMLEDQELGHASEPQGITLADDPRRQGLGISHRVPVRA